MGRITTVIVGKIGSCSDKNGCGECQTPCQSACKTSNTVANLSCVREESNDT